MEPAAILDQLTTFEDLPREALRAATERRTELVPLFIEEIEGCVRGHEADGDLLLFAFHLLGSWREVSAYRPLARLLRSDPDRLDTVLGYCITETAHRVMAAVFDGDPEPIFNIILDEKADEFARSRMCETLAMLVLDGRTDREPVAAFLRDCWTSLRPRRDCFVWNGWQSAIAMIGLVELKEIVKEAFDTGIVDAEWLAYGDFERDLMSAALNPTERAVRPGKDFTVFGDVIEELSSWYCYSEAAKKERERLRELPPPLLFPPPAPITNPLRGIGRNDPCPCGSGKKYKKCCLQ